MSSPPLRGTTRPESTVPSLALRPRDAAKSLGISERLLWEWTRRGLIPHVRLGKVLLYPTDGLREFLRERSQALPVQGGNNADH